MNILALDPAAITGFCTETTSGTWNLKPKSYESNGMKFIKMKSSLHEIVQAEEIDLIVYEKPSGAHFNGIRSHSNFEGVIVSYCEEHDIDYKDYSASEIKKFATGKGNCNKAKMIEACKETYKIEPKDDNHADAIHLFNLAIKQWVCN